MSQEANVIQVEIFGQTYNLKSGGDAGYIVSLAAYVDGKMREVARETKAVDTLRVAILAALNIADEHRQGIPIAGASTSSTGADPARPSNGKHLKGAGGVPPEIDRRAAEWIRILDEAIGS